MIRTLPILVALLAAPVAADDASMANILSEQALVDTLSEAIDLAADRNTRLENLVAKNGIKTSGMQPDGTVDVIFKNQTSRDVQLDLIGGYLDGECAWALQLPSRGAFNWAESLKLQAQLTQEGWPADIIDTTRALSSAECLARSSLVVLNEGCRAMLPIEEAGNVWHFAIPLPELCE